MVGGTGSVALSSQIAIIRYYGHCNNFVKGLACSVSHSAVPSGGHESQHHPRWRRHRRPSFQAAFANRNHLSSLEPARSHHSLRSFAETKIRIMHWFFRALVVCVVSFVVAFRIAVTPTLRAEFSRIALGCQSASKIDAPPFDNSEEWFSATLLV